MTDALSTPVSEKLDLLRIQLGQTVGAHSSLQNDDDAGAEVLAIFESLSKLAASERTGLQRYTNHCAFHTNVDQLLQRIDRIAESDRQIVSRSLRSPSKSRPETRFSAFCNMSVVESYVAGVKAVAFQLLAESHAGTNEDGSVRIQLTI